MSAPKVRGLRHSPPARLPPRPPAVPSGPLPHEDLSPEHRQAGAHLSGYLERQVEPGSPDPHRAPQARSGPATLRSPEFRSHPSSIQALLSAPNPDDPLAENIAKHWKENEPEALATGTLRPGASLPPVAHSPRQLANGQPCTPANEWRPTNDALCCETQTTRPPCLRLQPQSPQCPSAPPPQPAASRSRALRAWCPSERTPPQSHPGGGR